MPNEVELKLLIDPAHVTSLRRHPLLAAYTRQKPSTQRLLSIYYDTPDLVLHKDKVAVRLRRVGKRWIQTVKTEGTVAAGLHDRPEWEQETTENTLDLQTLPDPKLQEFFADEALRQALQPVFTTEFSRSRRRLEWPSGDVVEFALDQGEIRARGQTQPICEVELELKAGAPGRLFEVALGLQETLPLRLENVSKAERGYRLAHGETLASEKARSPVLDTELSVSDAFVRIAQSCLAHLQANEKGVLHGDDPEFIHQMRVAARRLRSAFSVFSDILSKERSEPMREELRWLAGELDGARNWDVFMLQTLPPIHDAFPEHEGLSWLTTHSAELCRQANDRARASVASARYQKSLLTFGAWLATNAWWDNGTLNPPDTPELLVIEFAARMLQKRHKQLKKRGAQLATLTAEERHAVRIAAKKMRYAAEFFSSLYPHKRTRRYIAALESLQDILGALNDAATTATLMQGIIPAESNARQQHAVGIVSGWAAGGSHVQSTALVDAWNEFVDRKLFWS